MTMGLSALQRALIDWKYAALREETMRRVGVFISEPPQESFF